MKKLVFGAWCAVLGAGMGFAAEPVEYRDWDGEKPVPANAEKGFMVLESGETK